MSLILSLILLQRPPINLTALADHVNLLRSDHARFWTVNNVDYVTSFPAIVLHDTGRSDKGSVRQMVWIFIGANRGGMEDCYHGPCDIYDHKDQKNNKINWSFLVQTTQTLIGEDWT